MEITQTLYVTDPKEWRAWLEKHYKTESEIWLVYYKKHTGKPRISYNDAVEESLCFGWIDSKPNKRDNQSYFQFFSRRNRRSNWSRVNKQRVERLLQSGRMATAGLQMVAHARETGTWTALDAVERLEVPDDLSAAFEAYADARNHWDAFPPSVRREFLRISKKTCK